MDYITPAVFVDRETERVDMQGMPDFGFFSTDKAKIKIDDPIPLVEDKPRRGRPPKKKTEDGVTVSIDRDKDLEPYQTNEPYKNMYGETDMLLKSAIGQLDSLTMDINEQLNAIKASKTLKNKYKYITDLSMTASSVVGNKISAIRELNKTITDANNLELRRIKELNLNAANEQDDDRHIMDLYNAFISTPMGSYSQLGPSNQDINMNANAGVTMMASGNNPDAGYNNYVNNMTPAQNAMRYENDPNIQTVVVYNKETGQRYFDIIDKSNGQSVPNMNRPDPFLLEDININVAMGIARHTQLDTVYPLVVIGADNSSIMEY